MAGVDYSTTQYRSRSRLFSSSDQSSSFGEFHPTTTNPTTSVAGGAALVHDSTSINSSSSSINMGGVMGAAGLPQGDYLDSSGNGLDYLARRDILSKLAGTSNKSTSSDQQQLLHNHNYNNVHTVGSGGVVGGAMGSPSMLMVDHHNNISNNNSTTANTQFDHSNNGMI